MGHFTRIHKTFASAVRVWERTEILPITQPIVNDV